MTKSDLGGLTACMRTILFRVAQLLRTRHARFAATCLRFPKHANVDYYGDVLTFMEHPHTVDRLHRFGSRLVTLYYLFP